MVGMNLQEAPPPTPTQQLATVLLGQDVRQWIVQQRNDGVTWRKIGRLLQDATGGRLDVTDTTLQSWARQDDVA